ncbi:hypothetical protein TTRE_0000077601 [Trichuris trichiura]|uniref:Uncharacterized protein n=1 Tax=Trichuris trichiura TaxID=36087 RepID=A0A077YXK2_TRITR|nr:hypothetical protein TTRE_0000077601 [Trichuris trichiura]
MNGSSVGQAESQNQDESIVERSYGDEVCATKAERSNQARLRSMEARNIAWRRKHELVQEAAKKVPRKSKEIVLDERKSDEDDYRNGGLALFDDDSQEADVSWPDRDISEAKTRMLLQQGKIGSDPRFRMNDLFLADFIQDKENEDFPLDDETDETKRQLSIAEKIVGFVEPSRSKADKTLNSASARKSRSAKTFPIGVRYDPENPSHQRFELHPSPSTSHVNGAKSRRDSYAPVVSSSIREQTVAPVATQVILDPEFSERLKASEWDDGLTEEFSLLAAFGRTEVQQASNEGQVALEEVDTRLNAAHLEAMGTEPRNKATSVGDSVPKENFKSAAPKKEENMKRFRHQESIDSLRKSWANEQLTFRTHSYMETAIASESKKFAMETAVEKPQSVMATALHDPNLKTNKWAMSTAAERSAMVTAAEGGGMVTAAETGMMTAAEGGMTTATQRGMFTAAEPKHMRTAIVESKSKTPESGTTEDTTEDVSLESDPKVWNV